MQDWQAVIYRGKNKEVIPCNTLGNALEECNRKVKHCRVAVILKRGEGINSDNYYLHQIVK